MPDENILTLRQPIGREPTSPRSKPISNLSPDAGGGKPLKVADCRHHTFATETIQCPAQYDIELAPVRIV